MNEQWRKVSLWSLTGALKKLLLHLSAENFRKIACGYIAEDRTAGLVWWQRTFLMDVSSKRFWRNFTCETLQLLPQSIRKLGWMQHSPAPRFVLRNNVTTNFRKKKAFWKSIDFQTVRSFGFCSLYIFF